MKCCDNIKFDSADRQVPGSNPTRGLTWIISVDTRKVPLDQGVNWYFERTVSVQVWYFLAPYVGCEIHVVYPGRPERYFPMKPNNQGKLMSKGDWTDENGPIETGNVNLCPFSKMTKSVLPRIEYQADSVCPLEWPSNFHISWCETLTCLIKATVYFLFPSCLRSPI